MSCADCNASLPDQFVLMSNSPSENTKTLSSSPKSSEIQSLKGV
jgi:hypothetical protein